MKNKDNKKPKLFGNVTLLIISSIPIIIFLVSAIYNTISGWCFIDCMSNDVTGISAFIGYILIMGAVFSPILFFCGVGVVISIKNILKLKKAKK